MAEPAAYAHGMLPRSLAELERIIGLPATIKLVDAYGGATQYVPRPASLTPEHALVALLGWEPACALAENYGGDILHIAKGCAALRAARNAQIVHDHYRLGKPQRQLALEYHLDERHIRTIVTRTAMRSEQIDLFAP